MHTINLIKAYVSLYMKRQVIYRFNFSILVADIIMQLTIFALYSGVFLSIDNLNGYSYSNALIILATSQITFSLFSFMFGNIFRIGNTYIRNGELTKFMIRPVNLLLQIFFDEIYIGDFGGFIVGMLTLIYAIMLDANIVSLASIILYFTSILLAVTILLGFFLVLVSFNFISIGTMDLQLLFLRNLDVGKYPTNIFPKIVQIAFVFFVPFAVMGYIPFQILTGNFVGIAILFAIAVMFLSGGLLMFYKLKNYYNAVN